MHFDVSLLVSSSDPVLLDLPVPDAFIFPHHARPAEMASIALRNVIPEP